MAIKFAIKDPSLPHESFRVAIYPKTIIPSNIPFSFYSRTNKISTFRDMKYIIAAHNLALRNVQGNLLIILQFESS
jgi:hypothetical protein